MGGMIPWLILSHVGYDFIKKNKKKKENGKPHIWLEEGGRKLPPFDPYGQCSSKGEEKVQRERRKAKRKRKRNEKKK